MLFGMCLAFVSFLYLAYSVVIAHEYHVKVRLHMRAEKRSLITSKVARRGVQVRPHQEKSRPRLNYALGAH